MSNVTEIQTLPGLKLFIEQGPSVVDFAQRNGCAPCRALWPHYEAVASNSKAHANHQMDGVSFAVVYLDEVDIELFAYVTQELAVRSTPTLLYFDGTGKEAALSKRVAPQLIKEIQDIE